MENNAELENELEMEEQEELEMLSSNDAFVELEIEKEERRMSREIVLNNKTINEMVHTDKFQKGMEDANYYCGMYTNLINVGLSNEQAFDFINNMQVNKHNQDMQNLVNKGQLAIASVQQMQLQQQSL